MPKPVVVDKRYLDCVNALFAEAESNFQSLDLGWRWPDVWPLKAKGRMRLGLQKPAAERTSSPEEARYATWLAAVATGWNDDAQIENLVAGDDIWASMAREQRDAVQFEEELEQRRKTAFSQ